MDSEDPIFTNLKVGRLLYCHSDTTHLRRVLCLGFSTGTIYHLYLKPGSRLRFLVLDTGSSVSGVFVVAYSVNSGLSVSSGMTNDVRVLGSTFRVDEWTERSSRVVGQRGRDDGGERGVRPTLPKKDEEPVRTKDVEPFEKVF